MTYNTRQLKNGKQRGYLEFDTGKKIMLNEKEVMELETEIKLWKWGAVEKSKKIYWERSLLKTI